MNYIWYQFVKFYIRTTLNLFFKKITVEGLHHIPKDTALLYLPNHQNALIDPLLVGAYMPEDGHFIVQAKAFEQPILRRLLQSVNGIPIYRIRDGYKSLSKNKSIFNKCYRVLSQIKSIIFFPEGNHHINKRVRPLSKGFTRIAFGAIQADPNLNLKIIPTGINYSEPTQFGSKVRIIFGEPISVNACWTENDPNLSVVRLKKAVYDALKSLVVHIDDAEQYEAIYRTFEPDDFLLPEKINPLITRPDFKPLPKKQLPTKFNPFYYLLIINTLIPYLAWRWRKPKIKEIEYFATIKYAIGITSAPVIYLIQAGIVAAFFGTIAGWLYLAGCIVLIWLAKIF